MKILVKTLKGLEDVLAEEIEKIGGKDIKVFRRAVEFEGGTEELYRANVELRTALRVLMVKKVFFAKNEDQLYKTMYNIPWESIMKLGDTFSIDCTSNSEIFRHSKYAALKTKDAIVDRYRDKFGKRPNVNIHTPTYRINLHINNERITLSLDSSGESLHLRGYRENTVDAPLNEVLAAGILMLTGWNGNSNLMDPMCGSGTLVIEATKIALGQPPQQRDREYGFMKWKSYDKKLMDQVVEKAFALKKREVPQILARDKSLRSVKVAQVNAQAAGVSQYLDIEKKDILKTEPMENMTVISNPPYDVRLKDSNINRFYQNILNHLLASLKESQIWIFTGNIEALEAVQQNADETVMLDNGGIPANLKLFRS